MVRQERQQAARRELDERRRIGRPHGRAERDQVEVDELARVAGPRRASHRASSSRRDSAGTRWRPGRSGRCRAASARSPAARGCDGRRTSCWATTPGRSARASATTGSRSVTAKLIVVSNVSTPELLEQRHQVRVGAVVVHDEARVDAEPTGQRIVDVDRVGVTAETIVGLEQHDVVVSGRAHGRRSARRCPNRRSRSGRRLRCDRRHCRIVPDRPAAARRTTSTGVPAAAPCPSDGCAASRWISRRRRSSQNPPDVLSRPLVAGQPDDRVGALFG